MSNHRAMLAAVSNHRSNTLTIALRIGAIAMLSAILGACGQISANPTGPLPDCAFQPSTELCGHDLARGANRKIPM